MSIIQAVGCRRRFYLATVLAKVPKVGPAGEGPLKIGDHRGHPCTLQQSSMVIMLRDVHVLKATTPRDNIMYELIPLTLLDYDASPQRTNTWPWHGPLSSEIACTHISECCSGNLD